MKIFIFSFAALMSCSLYAGDIIYLPVASYGKGCWFIVEKGFIKQVEVKSLEELELV